MIKLSKRKIHARWAVRGVNYKKKSHFFAPTHVPLPFSIKKKKMETQWKQKTSLVYKVGPKSGKRAKGRWEKGCFKKNKTFPTFSYCVRPKKGVWNGDGIVYLVDGWWRSRKRAEV